MSQVTLNVPAISCGHCEKTVMEALEGQPGVNSVRVDVSGKKVYLDYDEGKLSLDTVSEILDEEGYEVASTREGFPDGGRGFIPLQGR